MKYFFVGIIFAVMFSSTLAFGENYRLEVDEHTFDIHYHFGGDLIAMAVDQELTSFLVGIENVAEDTDFHITLPHEVISAENNEFAVLVNGLEVDYQIASDDVNSEFLIPIPAFTEEIEIIGTKVIPEFPLGVLFVLVVMTSMVIILSKNKNLFR